MTESDYCGEHPARQRLAIAREAMAGLLAAREGKVDAGYAPDEPEAQARALARYRAEVAKANRQLADRSVALADELLAALARKAP